MATTTASLTLSSSDLLSDALSLSSTNTLYKAGTTTGLDQTTGLSRVYLDATTNVDIFPSIVEGNIPGENKNAKVYIANLSTTATEYVTITLCSQVIGRLYAGDWMFMPWSMQEDTHSDNKHGDIELTPSVDTGMTVEFMCIHEAIEYPAAV
jgi:hypothetical protein